MATCGTEKHSRLTLMMSGWLKLIRAIINKHVHESCPEDWTLDDVLDNNREAILDVKSKGNQRILNPHQFRLMFPGRKSTTDIEQWDIQMLSLVLVHVCGPNMKTYREIFDTDIKKLRKIRNKLCHAGSPVIADDSYDTYVKQVKDIIEIYLKYLNDDTVSIEMNEFLIRVESGSMGLDEQTKLLKDWYDSDKHIEKVLVEVTAGLTEVSGKMDALSEDQKKMMREIHLITLMLGSRRVPLPDTVAEIIVTNCDGNTEKFITDKLISLLDPELRDSPELSDVSEEIRRLVRKVMTIFLSNGKEITEAKAECIIMKIGCPSFQSLYQLWQDCIDGTATELFQPIQQYFRRLEGCSKLEIEVIVRKSEIWRCLDIIVSEISEVMQAERIREEISIVQEEEVLSKQKDAYDNQICVVDARKEQHSGQQTGQRIRMKIKSQSIEQLLHIWEACESGKVNKKLDKVAEAMMKSYGLTDLHIEAKLDEDMLLEGLKEQLERPHFVEKMTESEKKVVTADTTNCLRLHLLNVEGGTPVLREVFLKEVENSSAKGNIDDFLNYFKSVIDVLKYRRVISIAAYKKLFPDHGSRTDIQEWDVSLLSLVLLQCCTLEGKLGNLKGILNQEVKSSEFKQLDTFLLDNKVKIDSLRSADDITVEQYDTLFPPSTQTCLDDWDTDLLIVVLLNLCKPSNVGKVTKTLREAVYIDIQLCDTSLNVDVFLKDNSKTIEELRNKGNITDSQYYQLYPKNGVQSDITNWDDSLLRKIVLHVGKSLLSNTISSIKIIRCLRNTLVAHKGNAAIDDDEFRERWTENYVAIIDILDVVPHIKEDVMKAINKISRGALDIQSAIDTLKTFYLKDETTNRIILDELNANESSIIQNIKQSEANIKQQIDQRSIQSDCDVIRHIDMKHDEIIEGIKSICRNPQYKCVRKIPGFRAELHVCSTDEDIAVAAEEIMLTGLKANPRTDAFEQFAKGIEGEDTEIKNVTTGSVILYIQCDSTSALLTCLQYYESGRMQESALPIQALLRRTLSRDLEISIHLNEHDLAHIRDVFVSDIETEIYNTHSDAGTQIQCETSTVDKENETSDVKTCLTGEKQGNGDATRTYADMEACAGKKDGSIGNATEVKKASAFEAATRNKFEMTCIFEESEMPRLHERPFETETKVKVIVQNRTETEKMISDKLVSRLEKQLTRHRGLSDEEVEVLKQIVNNCLVELLSGGTEITGASARS